MGDTGEKIEDTGEALKGQAREAAGNEKPPAKGKVEQAEGEFRAGFGRLGEKIRDAANEVKEKVHGATD